MIIIIYWIAFFSIIAVYIGYPITIFIISKVYRVHINKGDITPMLSVIISAHNEENVIEKKINNTLGIDYPKEKFEVIVVSDGSTDMTNDILSRYSKRIKTVEIAENRGKTNAINQAMEVASGEIVVFTDANVRLAKDAVRKLVANFVDPSVGCVCGQSTYSNPDESETAGSHSLYWRYENFLKYYESQTGSMCVADGAIFGIRRSLYTPLAVEDIDDFATSMLILSKGYRVILDPRSKAFEKSAILLSEELRRRRRISNRLFSTYRRIRHELHHMAWFDKYKFFFHRLLRWYTFLLLMSILMLNVALMARGPIYTVLFAFQVIFYFLFFIGLMLGRKVRLPKWIFIPYFFVIMNYTQLMGIVDSLRGIRYITWQSPHTTRKF